jgi:beta,beta-carotene 9',10'-dioxygenase
VPIQAQTVYRPRATPRSCCLRQLLASVRATDSAPGPRSGFHDQIVKLDFQTEQLKTWFELGCYPGEPISTVAPGARQEDEGILLSVVLDGKHRNSCLLVLDAVSLIELARATVPHHVPFGFHGMLAST